MDITPTSTAPPGLSSPPPDSAGDDTRQAGRAPSASPRLQLPAGDHGGGLPGRRQITARCRTAASEVRLNGRRPRLPGPRRGPDPPAPPAAAEPEEVEDGNLARITLRIPESVKAKAEERAPEAGQSLNTWLVNVVRAASRDGSINIDVDLSSIPFFERRSVRQARRDARQQAHDRLALRAGDHPTPPDPGTAPGRSPGRTHPDPTIGVTPGGTMQREFDTPEPIGLTVEIGKGAGHHSRDPRPPRRPSRWRGRTPTRSRSASRATSCGSSPQGAAAGSSARTTTSTSR